MGRAVAVAAALGLVLAGCSVVSGIAQWGNNHSEKPISSLRVPMTPDLLALYGQKINWQTCGKSDRCGYVYAPLDWNEPGGKQIHLALIEHPASGKKIGTLLVNPGGPGGSGVDLVGSGVLNAVDADVADHYDVVGFDPRGVGYSSAVSCGSAKSLDTYLYGTVKGAIGSPSWVAGQKAKSAAFAAACKKGTGALLAHVDTVSAAHDLDLMRAVLGAKKLDYLGYSYGTYLGTVYAGLYPQNVGRLVFDGPDDPWFGSGGGSDSQAAGFDDDLDAYLRSCVADMREAVGSGTCPFPGSFTGARSTVEHELASATNHPIRNGDGRELNAATLATAIGEALYDTSSWPELTRMFTGVAAANSTIAFQLADQYNGRTAKGKYPDNLDQADQAITCLEDGHSIDLGYDAKELTELKKSAPILGPYQSYSDLECAGWPYGPSPEPEPIAAKGAPPIVLVGTTGDPATPYSGAKTLTRQLATGHLITFHGEGHTAYDKGHACVDHAVDAYLITGTVPKTNLQCY